MRGRAQPLDGDLGRKVRAWCSCTAYGGTDGTVYSATGFYSGFVIASSNAGGGGGGPPGGGNGTGGPPGGGFPGAGGPSGTASPSRTGTTSGAASTTTSLCTPFPRIPSLYSSRILLAPLSGADSGGRGGGGQNATDNLTFLRGVTQADDKGEATMYTLVPGTPRAASALCVLTPALGWYTGRAVHIHIRGASRDSRDCARPEALAVFNGSSVADNGTFISSSGVAHHTGQVFFSASLLSFSLRPAPHAGHRAGPARRHREARAIQPEQARVRELDDERAGRHLPLLVHWRMCVPRPAIVTGGLTSCQMTRTSRPRSSAMTLRAAWKGTLSSPSTGAPAHHVRVRLGRLMFAQILRQPRGCECVLQPERRQHDLFQFYDQRHERRSQFCGASFLAHGSLLSVVRGRFMYFVDSVLDPCSLCIPSLPLFNAEPRAL